MQPKPELGHHERIGFTPCFHVERTTLRLAFACGGQSCAHGIRHTPAEAPDIVRGVVNIQVRGVPVINMRRRFHVPEREIALTGRLVIARTARRPVALVADAVPDIIARTAPGMVTSRDILPGARYVEGVVKLEDDLIFIHDLDKFLSLEEKNSLGYAPETH